MRLGGHKELYPSTATFVGDINLLLLHACGPFKCGKQNAMASEVLVKTSLYGKVMYPESPSKELLEGAVPEPTLSTQFANSGSAAFRCQVVNSKYLKSFQDSDLHTLIATIC